MKVGPFGRPSSILGDRSDPPRPCLVATSTNTVSPLSIWRHILRGVGSTKEDPVWRPGAGQVVMRASVPGRRIVTSPLDRIIAGRVSLHVSV